MYHQKTRWGPIDIMHRGFVFCGQIFSVYGGHVDIEPCDLLQFLFYQALTDFFIRVRYLQASKKVV